MACLWSNPNKAASFLLTLFIFLLSSRLGRGQSSNTTCVNDLIPCANYINTTSTPPASCCDNIKKAVNTELSCLCTLYDTPGLLSQFGVNVTQAIQLTQRCGVPADTSTCNKTAEAPSSGSVPPPPAVPGNDGNMITFTGFSTLLVALVSLMMQ